MSDERPPDRDAVSEVPDVVLEELMAAFAVDQDPRPEYDFDDPSIDRLLGLVDAEAAPADRIADEQPVPVEHPPVDADAAIDVTSVESGVGSASAPPSGRVPAPAAVPNGQATTRKIIHIEGDDQPDALYLDEAGEDRLRSTHPASGDLTGERATIVINDDDGPSAVEPTAIGGGSGIDPRLRARRIAVRRAEGRRRLVWVAVVAAIVLVAVGVAAVLASTMFAVDRIDVEGAVYTDPVALKAVVDDLRGTPVLLVDTRAAEAKLEQIPWVESAKVSTDFPHRVVIQIRERTPIATFQGADGRFRVIDRDGRVLDVLDGNPIAYMLITGTNPDTDQGLFAGAPYAAAAQLVIALPPEIRTLTASVGVDVTTGSLSLQFHDGIEVQLGASANMPDKLARLLQRVREGLDGVKAIDVSTAEVSVTNG